MHDAALPKLPNMLMFPAGVLSYLVNIRRKEGLATHVAKHPISEELATVGKQASKRPRLVTKRWL